MKTDKQALPVQGNILVVDDNRADLRLLVGILAERGHIVRPTLDGASALTGAQAEPPDMILLDVNMPHIDGYEVCRRLKSDDRTGDIPVIFISASDEIFDKVEAFSIGGVDYITKPFQTEEVLARLETHLTLHSVEQRLKTQNSALQQEIAERKRVEAELQQHRDHLEKLVAARTADLQVANRQLQREIAERKQAEETLRENEERLRVALEGTADGIWDWNPTTGQAYYSPRYYTMLGYEPGEFPPTYESWQQLLHPDDREVAEKNVHHAVEEHIPFAIEFRLKAKNGEWRWILGRGKVAELDMEGKAVRVAGSHTDITERKRAEESMTKFFEQSLVMLYIADMEKNVLLRVNNEVVRITGRTEEELLSIPFLEFFSAEDREASMKTLAMLAEGKPVIGFRNRHLTANGDCRIFEWTATPDTEHKLVYAMARDVTEQIVAEEALRIEKESLDKLFESPVVAVFLIDENRKIKRINSTFTKLFGYTPEEAIGQDIVDLTFLDDDDKDESEMLMKRAIKGERIEFEARRRRKDGTLLDVLISYAPVFIDDRYLGTYVTIRDISQRKRAEEALEKRIVALTQPLDTAEGIAFEDLFDLTEIQHLQDLYAEAFGVAALITLPDGTPITQPSNFSELCGEIIRKTPKGVKNCNYSDALIGRHNSSGPNIQPCLSAGLCNAGVSITVGGRHVANWLVGQVRNETQNEEEIMKYAREIGADETAFRAAYRKVPTMSQEQFERVAHVLFAVADQLSTSAYQNVQQARFIAERKRAEIVLRESEARWRSLVDNAPAVITTVDADGRILTTNRAVSDRDITQVVGTSLYDYLLPEDQGRVRRAVEAVFRTGTPQRYEIHGHAPPGGEYWFETHLSAIRPADEVEAAILVSIDITARKRAEQALRDSEKRLALVFNNTSDMQMLIAVDSNSRLRAEMYNHSYIEALSRWGYDPSQLDILAKDLYGWLRTLGFSQENIDAAKLYHQQAIEGRVTVEYEQLFPTPVDMFYTHVTITPVSNNQGSITHLLYSMRDITERKRAEEELIRYRQHLEELVAQRTAELNARVAEAEQLNQALANLLEDLQAANRNAEITAARLKEVNQELADFAHVVSHDLKAPLRGISQLAGWLSEDYAPVLDAQGQQWLSLLIGRTRRMHNLIEGILQYSRIGRVKEKERDVDLNHLVEEVIALLAPPQHIQVSVVGELPKVVGEPARLAQVFQNLLSNAIKFMDKPQGKIEVGCVDEGTYHRFSVADNGPGMAAQYHDKIFQIFQTLAPRDEMENTGIGLALVKKIVEAWGGRVWLESAEGQGSTFYFTLPK
jgi:PAS domain S-box-containing protein